jgi:hypothetical protein
MNPVLIVHLHPSQKLKKKERKQEPGESKRAYRVYTSLSTERCFMRSQTTQLNWKVFPECNGKTVSLGSQSAAGWLTGLAPSL